MPEIQFTIEEEVNGCLPFMDVLMMRSANGTLQTSVYRKSMATDTILAFQSNHPTSHKQSCVRTLFLRAQTHCSTPESLKGETRRLCDQFTKNGYPKTFVNACLRKRPKRRDEKRLTYATLPYIRGVSEAAERLLKPLGVRAAHKPTETLRLKLCRMKDPVEPHDLAGVVYKIPCTNCSQCYVGETGKELKTRLHEHHLAMWRADKLSHLWQHCSVTGHEINLKNAAVIGRAKDRHERLVLEAVLSHNSFNRHIDLNPNYSVITSQIRPPRTNVRQTGTG